MVTKLTKIQLFQHTAARRRLGRTVCGYTAIHCVSTHSRPKAAGQIYQHNFEVIGFQHTAARRRLAEIRRPFLMEECFNTQPPEGGWEGRLLRFQIFKVSTHSRPKAAGCNCYTDQGSKISGFNTQPPEGGWEATGKYYEAVAVSTHSRPKAAGRRCRRV